MLELYCGNSGLHKKQHLGEPHEHQSCMNQPNFKQTIKTNLFEAESELTLGKSLSCDWLIVDAKASARDATNCALKEEMQQLKRRRLLKLFSHFSVTSNKVA